MTHEPSLRVGVIGTGWVATARHLPALRRDRRVRLEAVYDRDTSKAATVAGRFGIARSFDRLDDFLESVDAVTICTPPWVHAEAAIAALAAGCHVFCEKPMAVTLSDAEAMVEAAASAGRILCISHNFLSSRSVRRADRLMGGDEILYGSGLQLSSARRRLPDWYGRLPGGLFLDESPHMLYTLAHFLGNLELESATMTTQSDGHPRVVEVLLKGSRAPGRTTMVFGGPVSEWQVGIVGAQKVCALDLFRDISVVLGSDHEHKAADILKSSASAIGQHAAGFASSGVRWSAQRQYWGHDELLRDFVGAALGGSSSPVDPEESLAVVRLTAAILNELGLTR